MSQGIQISDAMAVAKQQQAALNKLRINIAVGLHKDLVAKTFSFGPQCLPGDEWKLKQAEDDGPKVPIGQLRQAIAQEALAQADALMEAFGYKVTPNDEPQG